MFLECISKDMTGSTISAVTGHLPDFAADAPVDQLSPDASAQGRNHAAERLYREGTQRDIRRQDPALPGTGQLGE